MPKSLRIHNFTGVDGIRLDEVPIAEPKNTDIRVKAEGFALNWGDFHLMHDEYVFGGELPFCFGDEATGLVDAIGPDVTKFKVGDRVSTVTFLNEGYGVNSEYFLWPERYLTKYPNNLSAVEGASIWVQYLTAYYALYTISAIKPTDFMLNIAASSSAGIGGTQLAKLAGAQVIGTSRSLANATFIESTGADHVISTGDGNVSQQIMEITKGAGVRIVYDPGGGELLSHYADSLAQDANIFLYGLLSGQQTPIPIIECIQANAVIRPHSVYNFVNNPELRKAGIQFISEALEKEKIKPLIDQTFPIDRFREAFEYQLAAKNRKGKIVITF